MLIVKPHNVNLLSMPNLEVVIGLEVHAQMNTKSKMFCGCDNDAFGKPPNTTVCPICMGHPGTLPAPNEEAIKKAMKASLAIGCKIQEENHFDRKHYFYPDLPPGFQISQYDFPLSLKGEVKFNISDDSGNTVGKQRVCGITRLHMENDAGKLTHRGSNTLCDYNRAGTPLMEIVTEPDLRSPEEAVAFAQELRRILIAVNASEADMFKGMMRFDASVSLRKKGSKKLNPRSEIKNLNSFKSLEKALTYEIKRLNKKWDEEGGPLKNDITVGWVDDEEQTKMLRDKETAMDYRYFPEPDIPPLKFTKKDIEELKADMPALPSELKTKYEEMGLEDFEVRMLIDQPYFRSIFDKVAEQTKDVKRSRSIVLTQLAGFVKSDDGEEKPDVEFVTEQIVALIADERITKNQEKEYLKDIVDGMTVEKICEDKGVRDVDESEMEELISKAIEANPKAVESFKAGKEQAIGAIVGWVMKESGGQADPSRINEMLKMKLK